jgi:acyl carrier protein
MAASEGKLKQVIADVFGIEIKTIGENTSVDTVREWDSLKHLNLVLALESEFDISFTEEQTVQILSYPLIKAILEEHSIHFI